MRFALAVLVTFHGLAHLPGFAGSWRLADLPDFPYHTRLLQGRIDVGDGGMRLIGAIWLLVTLAFVVAGLGGIGDEGWWAGTAFIAALVSLVLCAIEWPAARIGVPVNVAIVLALLAGRYFGWT